MTPKGQLTKKQERFAQLLATGMSQADAYRQAGYTATGNHIYEGASELAATPKVRQRVDQLKAALQPKIVGDLTINVLSVTSMLIATYQAATQDRQHSAAVQATLGMAKLHGLLVDKVEDVTRRATRDPRAPVEIEVEHWVTEQVKAITGPDTAQ